MAENSKDTVAEHGKERVGEGNREAARRFNEKEQAFVNSDEGKKAITDGSTSSSDDKRAEEQARGKAKEKDPQVTRDYENQAG